MVTAIALAVLSIAAGVYATSTSYANASEMHREAQLHISEHEDLGGNLIYDDGRVQTFNGKEDSNMPTVLSDTDIPGYRNKENIENPALNSDVVETEKRIPLTDFEKTRGIVLQRHEYRSKKILENPFMH